MTRYREFIFAFFLIVVVVFSGCGSGRPSRVKVSGRVLVDGKPLTHGDVLFIPAKGRQATGNLNKEGKFTLTCFEPGDGTIAGLQRIAVLSAEPKGAHNLYWHAPQKYADHTTSGIEKNIIENTNDLVIELTWKDNPPGHPFLQVIGAEQGEADDPRPGARKNKRKK